MKTFMLVLLSLVFAVGCGQKNKNEESSGAAVSPEEAAVETAMAAVGGLSDEQSGESYTSAKSSVTATMYAVVQDLVLPKAYAANCGRALYEACISGVREAGYQACNPLGSSASLTGFVRLTYAQSDCSMNTGDSVTRTYDLDLSGPRGGTASVSSDSAADYRGTSYGGGGRLTKTATGHTVDVLGKHIALSFRGRPLYNVSIRTLSSITQTGTLSRQNRNVDGGQLEVNHNLAQFTALFQPHSLQWSSGCCHPVSGTLDVQYSGSRTGSATVTFNGCGSAAYSDGTLARTLRLNYCE